jgi:GTPase-associated protein 1
VAWQLHYTSARSGTSGRAGFQFVAATPGLPPGAEATIGPHLTYRPPPGAPPAPGPSELARLPVAFSYDLADGHALLVRCRYLGRDYSGRYGNFLAHAVVAEPGELVGVRPIELWRAGFWCDAPASGDLPRLDDLAPGDAFDPETLARWLAAEQAYGLFAHLMDAVLTTIAQGHGQVTLVADDVDAIARWFAVVSYSLPAAAAAALSFVTYTDDPRGAPYRLVGTTPDAWAAAPGNAPAFHIDADIDRSPTLGRYARTAADRWREHDLAGLDALGELAGLGAGFDGFDTAAALLALCRGEPAVAEAEEAAAAGLLRRHGGDVPAWVWRELAPVLPKLGFELAAALCDLTGDDPAGEELAERCAARCVLLALADPALRPRLPHRASAPVQGPGPGSRRELGPAFTDAVAAAPSLIEIATIAALAERCHVPLAADAVAAAAAHRAGAGATDLLAAIHAAPPHLRDSLVAGALSGLETAPANSRAALLTDAVCDIAVAHDLSTTPRVALRVLSSVGRRRKARRVELTREAIALDRPGLPADEIDAALRSLWSGTAPTIAECDGLLDSWGPDTVAAALVRYPTLAMLPSRAFAAAQDGLGAPEVLRLANRVDAVPWPDGGAVTLRGDAAVVIGHVALARAAVHSLDVPALASSLDDVAAAPASPALLDAVFAVAAERLAGRPAELRESLLAAVGEPARARLVYLLPPEPERRGLDRRRLFRRRGRRG